jgi:hypothetical protein
MTDTTTTTTAPTPAPARPKTPPRIWEQGGVYMAEVDGKIKSSPSYERLAEEVGLLTSKAERERVDREAREQADRERRQAAADTIPELEAAADQADRERRDAHARFVEAVQSDPVWTAYAELLAATKTTNGAKYRASAARAESLGRQPGSGANVLPDLIDVLTDAVGAPRTEDLSMHGSPSLDAGNPS